MDKCSETADGKHQWFYDGRFVAPDGSVVVYCAACGADAEGTIKKKGG